MEFEKVELWDQSFDELKEIFKETGNFLLVMQKEEEAFSKLNQLLGRKNQKLILKPLHGLGYKLNLESKAQCRITLNGLPFYRVTKIELSNTYNQITLFYENDFYPHEDRFDFEVLKSIGES